MHSLRLLLLPLITLPLCAWPNGAARAQLPPSVWSSSQAEPATSSSQGPRNFISRTSSFWEAAYRAAARRPPNIVRRIQSEDKTHKIRMYVRRNNQEAQKKEEYRHADARARLLEEYTHATAAAEHARETWQQELAEERAAELRPDSYPPGVVAPTPYQPQYNPYAPFIRTNDGLITPEEFRRLSP